MAVKSVIEVQVSDESFKEFLALFEKYKSSVDKMPKGWGAIGSSVQNATKPVKNFVNSVHEAVNEFKKAESASGKMAAGLKLADRTVTSIARTTTSIARDVVSTTGQLAKWATFGIGTFGALAGGSLFGLDKLAAGAGDIRKQAQGLGVSGTELEASKIAFGKPCKRTN